MSRSTKKNQVKKKPGWDNYNRMLKRKSNRVSRRNVRIIIKRGNEYFDGFDILPNRNECSNLRRRLIDPRRTEKVFVSSKRRKDSE